MALRLPSKYSGLHRWFKRHRAGLMIVAAILVAAAFVALLWGAAWLDASQLRGLTPVQRESAIDAIRGRLIQLGAGLVIAGGLVYTGLTFRLNREGHVTERYTKAIDQLGSEFLDVRLGAIYALERIMIDSARDHPTIVEVLAAYVRGHAHLDTDVTDKTVSSVGAQLDAIHPIAWPDTDVQAAMTVLGRRPSGREERGALDLRGTQLIGVDLSHANLTRTRLSRADLRYANLQRANLVDAWMAEADLMSADLTNADLDGANLAHADLTDADLDGANLTRATLFDATLFGASLRGTNLSGATLMDAKIENNQLIKAKLTGAKLPPKITNGAQTDAGTDNTSPSHSS